MTYAETRASEVMRFYAQKTPVGASGADKANHASKAAQTRWEGRGGPSTPIRISSALAARLYAAIPQAERRHFCERAITEALDRI